jgi:predicted nucleic acid-binding Zn ribbon protein
MAEENSLALFGTAMEANNLVYEEKDDQLIIKKGRGRNKSLRLYITLAIIMIVVAILLTLFSPLRIGRLIGGIGVVLLFSSIGLRQREKEAMKNTVAIDREQVEIREGFKARRVKMEDIAEFKTTFKKIGNAHVGNVTIITERGIAYELLEIIGDSESLVQDDLLIISNYIVETYIND